jgi:hypothetical protein
MSVESESNHSFAFSQAISHSPSRVVDQVKQNNKLLINETATKTIF